MVSRRAAGAARGDPPRPFSPPLFFFLFRGKPRAIRRRKKRISRSPPAGRIGGTVMNRALKAVSLVRYACARAAARAHFGVGGPRKRARRQQRACDGRKERQTFSSRNTQRENINDPFLCQKRQKRGFTSQMCNSVFRAGPGAASRDLAWARDRAAPRGAVAKSGILYSV